MTTLRHADIVGHRVPSKLHRNRSAVQRTVRDYYAHAPHVKQHEHGGRLRSVRHMLLIGRDVLFALWAMVVLAFWVAIIAAFIL
jgi:hypothetical protein